MAITDSLNFLSTAKPTPAKLVEDALGTFEKAKVQMTAAQQAIKEQQAQHEAEAATLQAKAADCQLQHERLARVNDRLTDLLA